LKPGWARNKILKKTNRKKGRKEGRKEGRDNGLLISEIF
jgi:hypothetical protein